MALRLYLREPMAAFFTLAFPSLLLVLFGSIFGNAPTPMFGGRGTIDVSMPNYTGLILATVALMNIPITTSSYRELGILRRFRATPMRPLTYLAADVSTNLLMTLVGMLVVLVMGRVLYRVEFTGQLIHYLAAVVLSCLAMFSLGYLIASLATGARMGQVAGMLILYPMLFLSGSGMPIELLPELHPQNLGLPAADLRREPVEGDVVRRSVVRAPAGRGRPGDHDRRAGRAGGAPVPLGVSHRVGRQTIR